MVTGESRPAAGPVSLPVVTVPTMLTALNDPIHPQASPHAPSQTAGRLLFERLMARYERGQVEPLLDLFAADAEVVGFDGTRRGHVEIGAWLAEHFASRGAGFLVSTDQFVEDGDMVRFEATVAHLEGSVHQVYGVFVMAEGRIARYLPGQIADLNGAH